MNIFNWKSTLFSGPRITKIPERIKQLWASTKGDTLNEVLFYGAEDEEQRTRIGLNNLFCIYYVILHASYSIDICVPSLVSETIAKALISVQRKGNTRVRIAVYKTIDYGNLQSFANCGIEVKAISSTVQLEHEFILIDASEESTDAVVIIGSLDYEVARVNCNRDTTLLTSEPTVVSMLKREFVRVWNSTPDVLKHAYENSHNRVNELVD